MILSGVCFFSPNILKQFQHKSKGFIYLFIFHGKLAWSIYFVLGKVPTNMIRVSESQGSNSVVQIQLGPTSKF